MPEIKFSCRHCDQPIECDAGNAGSTFPCPSCQKILTVPALPVVERRDVFLSYRREGGEYLARLVMKALVQRGFSVFMDTESLKRGKFDSAILQHIELATDVVVICSPGALDRCVNQDDWVRQEISHALIHGKNVVRLMDGNFQMPPKESLPPVIAELANSQGLSQKSMSWDDTITLLADELLESKPDSRRRQVDELSDEGRTLAWNQVRAKIAAGIAGIVLLMILVSLPTIWNHALNIKWHRLGMIGKEKAWLAIICTLIILAGAWLSHTASRIGPWLILAASIVMAVGNVVLSYYNYKALQPFVQVFHRAIPKTDYLIWSVYIIPFIALACLYRKGK